MKDKLVLLLFCCCLFSCKHNPLVQQQKKANDILGLATPIMLKLGENKILMEDYFMDLSKIDSIVLPAALSFQLSDDKKELTIQNTTSIPPLSQMSIYTTEQRHYTFLLKASNKRKTAIRLKDDSSYKTVQLKGEMNNWDPNITKPKKEGGYWQFDFHLSPGNYQYIFVVNGKEMINPIPTINKVGNGFGGFNSLLELPKPDRNKLPILHTLSHNDEQIQIASSNPVDEIFVFWNNQRLATKYEKDKISFDIPIEAKKEKRSFIRVWAYNKEGLSNDLLIPLEYDKVLDDPSKIIRQDKEAQIMYFTLIDRFNNGNKDNDDPVDDERLLPQTNYLGGDIAGITQKIKDGYFKSLNINSIWLSPITQNPLEAFQEYIEPQRYYSGYHGYWPIRSGQIDHRFGTKAEMRELVKVAHENGINILLDYVCNHVHEQHSIFKKHPEWATQLDLPNGRKNLRLFDEERLTTWFDTFLPSLDLTNPEVIEMQSDSAIYWIKEYNLDGYRQDASKHVPLVFWRTLSRKLKEQIVLPENRPIYQIGETYGSRELINSYISSGLLDSQFDFSLYFEVREVLAKDDPSFTSVATSIRESFNFFGHHSTMGYMSGNHDQVRFISYAGGGLKFDEDSREAGFARDVGVGNPIGYKRLAMLQALNFSIPGVPVIFYGDEFGMPGAGDPDNRRMMKFDQLKAPEQTTLKQVRQLTELRSNRLSLIYGDTEILHADEKTFALARYYFDETSIAVFNKSKTPKMINVALPKRFSKNKLKTNFGSEIVQENNTIQVTLAPMSFDLLTD